MPSSNPVAVAGWQNPADFGSEFASRNFQIMSIIARIAGSTLVEVMGVNAQAGTVDIRPMVNQVAKSVDPSGKIITVGISHGTIYGCPYFQLQSGASGVILTPTVGDIGMAVFADRDISSVIATRKRSNPGSERKNDMADGVYFGGMLNAAPTQYVRFDAAGISITSPVAVNVHAPTVTITNGGAALALLNSNIAAWLDTHTHVLGTGVPVTPSPVNGLTTVVTAQ